MSKKKPDVKLPLSSHPAAVAWAKFNRQNEDVLEGSASGIYLENRLRLAFDAAWVAAETAVADALGLQR